MSFVKSSPNVVEVQCSMNLMPSQNNASYMLVFSDGVDQVLYRCCIGNDGNWSLNGNAPVSYTSDVLLERGYYILNLAEKARRNDVVEFRAKCLGQIDETLLDSHSLLCVLNESGMFLDRSSKSLMEHINIGKLDFYLRNCCCEFRLMNFLKHNNCVGKWKGALVCQKAVVCLIGGVADAWAVARNASLWCNVDELKEKYDRAIDSLFATLRKPVQFGYIDTRFTQPVIAQWYWKRIRNLAEDGPDDCVSVEQVIRFENKVLRNEIRAWMSVYDAFVRRGEIERVDSYNVADALSYGTIWDRVAIAMEHESKSR